MSSKVGNWQGPIARGASAASLPLLTRLHRYKKLHGRFVLAASAENV